MLFNIKNLAPNIKFIGLITATWVTLFTRISPTNLSYDRGIFISVAERLNAGDKLYLDVWDNKDPLFYYVIALGRSISPLLDIFIELMWLGIAGLGVWYLSSHFGFTRTYAGVVSFVLTPIVITGASYLPGYSHLPGTALCLMSVGLASKNRYWSSGVALGLLIFTKITTFPVALLACLTLIFLTKTKKIFIFILGALAASTAMVLILNSRGELLPYVNSLISNFHYSGNAVLLDSRFPPFISHLALTLSPLMLCCLVALTLLLALPLLFSGIRKKITETKIARDFWILSCVTYIASLLILGFTGLWWHHAQLLYVPACIFLPVVVFLLGSYAPTKAITYGLVVAVILNTGGLVKPIVKNEIAQSVQFGNLTELSPEASALIKQGGAAGRYARLGTIDDLGHAFGLRKWKLVCPIFHQYKFSPEDSLKSTIACIPNADFIIVSPFAQDAMKHPEDFPMNFRVFWQEAKEILTLQFKCRKSEGIEICKSDQLSKASN